MPWWTISPDSCRRPPHGAGRPPAGERSVAGPLDADIADVVDQHRPSLRLGFGRVRAQIDGGEEPGCDVTPSELSGRISVTKAFIRLNSSSSAEVTTLGPSASSAICCSTIWALPSGCATRSACNSHAALRMQVWHRRIGLPRRRFLPEAGAGHEGHVLRQHVLRQHALLRMQRRRRGAGGRKRRGWSSGPWESPFDRMRETVSACISLAREGGSAFRLVEALPL